MPEVEIMATLKNTGFRRVYPDKELEPNYFFWRKDIKHHVFKGLHIIVDKTISVYVNEPNHKIDGFQNGNGQDALIVFAKRTKENLLDIIKVLTK